jgi:GT2 family glycosyltransferase
MRNQPAYSVVVPFHSNERLLRFCLHSLLATLPAEVEKIVVLNNGREEALPPDTALKPFKVVRRHETLGYSGAINLGAEHARGKHLIFCDADTIYREPWFAQLVRFHRATANAGLVSSRLIDSRSGRVADFGIAFTHYNAPHPQRDLLPEEAATQGARKVQAACSANMVISAKLFSQIGRFDETLFNAYPDIDLCLRVNDHGHDCWVTSESTVYHRGDSAQSNRGTYKGDVKAVFMAKNRQRIRIDMDGFFRGSLSRFKNAGGSAGEYLLVDLSTVVDHQWHHDILREHVTIVGVYDYSLGVRDAPDIALIEHLGLNVVEARHAILYFVDRFVSLRENRLWHEMRRRKDDLVVDRNANVKTLAEIVAHAC